MDFAIVTRKDSLGFSRIIVAEGLAWVVAIVGHPGISNQVRVIVSIETVGVGITGHEPSQANLSQVRNKRKHLIAMLQILLVVHEFFNFFKTIIIFLSRTFFSQLILK